MEEYKKKEDLLGLQEAADYLDCSHQWLGKILNGDEEHPISDYFRQYAGRWRTTAALLNEYFTNAKVVRVSDITSEKEKKDHADQEPAAE